MFVKLGRAEVRKSGKRETGFFHPLFCSSSLPIFWPCLQGPPLCGASPAYLLHVIDAPLDERLRPDVGPVVDGALHGRDGALGDLLRLVEACGDPHDTDGPGALSCKARRPSCRPRNSRAARSPHLPRRFLPTSISRRGGPWEVRRPSGRCTCRRWPSFRTPRGVCPASRSRRPGRSR